jgi:hypothetical protein
MHSALPSRLGGAAGALLACLVLALAACGQPAVSPVAECPSETPSASSAPASAPPAPAPAGSPDPIYATIEDQVVALRELSATDPIDVEVIDEATLGEMLSEMQATEQPAAIVEANERLYKALGLLPADADLGTLTSDLLTAGVLGFYRDDVDKMFVVSRSGAVGGLEKFTFSHEYTHALQDQHFTVFKDQEGLIDQSDQLLARQAVYEGDASLVMTYWAFSNLSPEELAEAATINPDQQAVIDSMPAILRDTLTYPYTTGLFFVQGAQASGGWSAVDAIYGRMPVSTEQILHPEKYEAGEAPTPVAMPCLEPELGDGWSVALEDSFGELQTGIWLREGGAASPLDAAAGWGGDRLAVLNGPDGAWAVVLGTAWDSDADAAEFETAATTALGKAGGSGSVLKGSGETDRWVVIGSDDTVQGKVADALGLPG